MQSHIVKRIILPAFIAIFFLLIGIALMPHVNLQFSGISQISRSEARDIIDQFAEARQIDLSEFYDDQYFLFDYSGIDFLTRTYGVEKAIELAETEELPLAYWEFTFYRNVPRDRQAELYIFRVSPNGKLIKYQHQLPDSTGGANLDENKALEIATVLASRWPAIHFHDFELENASSVEKTRRTDHIFKFYHKTQRYNGGHYTFEIQISGDEITNVVSHFEDPENFISASGLVGGANLLFNSISVGVYALLFFITVIVFLQKYHAGLVGVRNGLRVGAIIYITYALQAIFLWDIFGMGTQIGAIGLLHKKYIIFGLMLTTSVLFIFLHTFSAWIVGDHIIRSENLPLLSGIDSIFNRRFLTKNIGKELPIGIAAGATIFGALQVFYFLLIKWTDAVPRIVPTEGNLFSYKNIFFGALATLIFNVIVEETSYRKFLIPYLYQKYKNASVAIIVAAALTSVVGIFFNEQHVFWPTYWSLLPYFFIALLQGFVFWRHGFLAALVSNAVTTIIMHCAPLLSSNAFSYNLTAYNFIALILLLLVAGMIAFYKGKFITFAPSEEPAHIRRIKEQTRMQKELEIAKRVQLGLLPKEKPQITGYDIAGVSYPALEVGGDYFDFINLEKGNLGIAIGDVSGKGVPAAIYMTLTKGILQSHAENDLSPRQVLNKVNSLMYRTIEKSWYVSMFYAVLETTEKKSVSQEQVITLPSFLILPAANRKSCNLQVLGSGLNREKYFRKPSSRESSSLLPATRLYFIRMVSQRR